MLSTSLPVPSPSRFHSAATALCATIKAPSLVIERAQRKQVHVRDVTGFRAVELTPPEVWTTAIACGAKRACPARLASSSWPIRHRSVTSLAKPSLVHDVQFGRWNHEILHRRIAAVNGCVFQRDSLARDANFLGRLAVPNGLAKVAQSGRFWKPFVPLCTARYPSGTAEVLGAGSALIAR
jgi:hypothetical protein